MIISYLPILMLLGVAILFPLALLTSTSLLGPKAQTGPKSEPYECGVPAAESSQEGHAVKFYRVAILFLLFDVEAALLFPWAVIFKNKLAVWGTPFMIVSFLLFLLILMAGYFYAWNRGALEWD